MPTGVILYGHIIGDTDVNRLRRNEVGYSLISKDAPILFSNTDKPELVFVDLDDARFSSPQFLMSIATGNKVKLIGKITTPTNDKALEVARFGVTELLDSNDCLKKLDKLLGSIEKKKEEKKAIGRSKLSIDAIHGQSEGMADIRQTIAFLAEVDFPSGLILGETGTGKSLISKVLHKTGTRAAHNLVEVNCSAIPDELFESELFGHVKGAFTDARSDKIGLFEYAEKGTLFLDEVGNLSPSAQGKLLKILEDKKLRRVGDINDKETDVRVVAATHVDLQQAIKEGKFREDLFFRLNLLTMEIPPLRDRLVDIPELVDHYVTFFSSLYGKPNLRISHMAVEAMQQYDWPGNIRQLCNIIERAVLLSKSDTISEADISSSLSNGRITARDREQIKIDLPPQGKSIKDIEQEVVKQVLNMFNWNKSEAAKYLGISRPRLRRILDYSDLEQNRRSK